jgi:hypothetical protein
MAPYAVPAKRFEQSAGLARRAGRGQRVSRYMRASFLPSEERQGLREFLR